MEAPACPGPPERAGAFLRGQKILTLALSMDLSRQIKRLLGRHFREWSFATVSRCPRHGRFGPKADKICGAANVHYVPIGDIARSA
jgi:hypothetical protein